MITGSHSENLFTIHWSELSASPNYLSIYSLTLTATVTNSMYVIELMSTRAVAS